MDSRTYFFPKVRDPEHRRVQSTNHRHKVLPTNIEKRQQQSIFFGDSDLLIHTYCVVYGF